MGRVSEDEYNEIHSFISSLRDCEDPLSRKEIIDISIQWSGRSRACVNWIYDSLSFEDYRQIRDSKYIKKSDREKVKVFIDQIELDDYEVCDDTSVWLSLIRNSFDHIRDCKDCQRQLANLQAEAIKEGIYNG